MAETSAGQKETIRCQKEFLASEVDTAIGHEAFQPATTTLQAARKKFQPLMKNSRGRS